MSDVIRLFPAKVEADGTVSCFQCECGSIFWVLDVTDTNPENWEWACGACGKSFNEQADDIYF